MNFSSEQELIDFGKTIGQALLSELSTSKQSKVIELIGDVGAGKTTFTRGLAQGLGVKTPVTSPSFTISKRYAFPLASGKDGILSHYDFYRLGEPGIMTEDLLESIAEPHSVTVIEWAETVDRILGNRDIYRITTKSDGSRTIKKTSIKDE